MLVGKWIRLQELWRFDFITVSRSQSFVTVKIRYQLLLAQSKSVFFRWVLCNMKAAPCGLRNWWFKLLLTAYLMYLCCLNLQYLKFKTIINIKNRDFCFQKWYSTHSILILVRYWPQYHHFRCTFSIFF